MATHSSRRRLVEISQTHPNFCQSIIDTKASARGAGKPLNHEVSPDLSFLSVSFALSCAALRTSEPASRPVHEPATDRRCSSIREINRINERELQLGIKGSWHDEYKGV